MIFKGFSRGKTFTGYALISLFSNQIQGMSLLCQIKGYYTPIKSQIKIDKRATDLVSQTEGMAHCVVTTNQVVSWVFY